MVGSFSGGNLFDGIKLDDPLKINRTEIMESFYEKLNEGSIIIRSPPLTGKTSLIQMFFQFLTETKKISRVCMISLIYLKEANKKRNDDEFNEHWKQKCIYSWEIDQNEDWNNLFHSEEETYILMDETQLIYERAELFWEANRMNHKIKLLCFALHENYISQEKANTTIISPSIYFYHKLTLSSILMNSSEQDELIEMYNKKYPDQSIPNEIRDLMKKELCGHIGLMKSTLWYIKDRLKTVNNPDLSKFYDILLSYNYICFLMTQRCYIAIVENISINFAFLNLLIDSNEGFIEVNHSDKYFMDAILCEKYGLFVKETNKYKLTAPIIQKMLKIQLKSGKSLKLFKETSSNKQDFENFLKIVLSLIKPKIITEQLSLSANETIIERVFQNEIYHIATSILSTEKVCPDVGRIFGSTGYLDLYINHDLKWGIELLRDGIKLEEHIDRFNKINGIYHDIPMNQWIILDFNRKNKVKKNLLIDQIHSNVWKILYSEENSLTVLTANDEFNINIKDD